MVNYKSMNLQKKVTEFRCEDIVQLLILSLPIQFHSLKFAFTKQP